MKELLVSICAILMGIIFVAVIKILTFSSKQIHNVKNVELIDIDKNIVSGHLSDAIQFKTISSPDTSQVDFEEFVKMRNYFEMTYPKFHTTLTKMVFGKHSILYRWDGKEPDLKPILLMSHYDVVAATTKNEEEWKHPPFAGTIADGYIWGRGTLDDKGSVLAIFEAVEYLLIKGFQPERTIYYAIGHDEEVGGFNGAAKISKYFESLGIEFEYILDEGGLIIDGMLPGVPAPTALVGIAEKGYLSVELTTSSSGGHSSAPSRNSAIGVLSSAVHKLENNPMAGQISGATETMFEYIGPEMSFVPQLLFANLWLTNSLLEYQFSKSSFTNAMLRTSTAVTMFEAGSAENVLPERARAVVNFRIIPGDSIKGVIEHVRNTINDTLVKINPISMGKKGGAEPSAISDVNLPSFKILRHTVKQIFPESILTPWLLIGTTDSRHYSKFSKNIYRFVPVQVSYEDMGGYHGSNERVSVESYQQSIRFYIQLIRNSNLRVII